MGHHLPLALRASSRRWAVATGVRVAIAAGLIAGLGVITGRMATVGLMYFGTACAVAFAIGVTTRIRLIGIAAQAAGAALGLLIGATSAPDPAVMVCGAAVTAFCSGALGRIGPQSAAFATMAVIGVAFAQFSGDGSAWTEQILWYCAGTGVVAIAVLPLSGLPALREERAAIADVFEAAADLLAAIGSSAGNEARARLASASAAARAAWFDDRFGGPFPTRPRYADLARQLRSAEAVALVATARYRDGAPTDPATTAGVREHADRLRGAGSASSLPDAPTLRGAPDPLPTTDSAPGFPGPDALSPRRLHGAAALLGARSSLLAGARSAVCMSVATGMTLLLHDRAHSFWLPLTVAVVVRPEYASIYVRTLNRTVGTVIGAAVAAVAMLVFGSGWPIAVCTALSLGFAAAAAPKLYGLSVIGITCSALLCTSISVADPIAPVLRLVDTVTGGVIAMVLGYLVWPRRFRTPDGLATTGVIEAASHYLEAVAHPGGPAPDERVLSAARNRAYSSAHRLRFAAQAALADPRPGRTLGAAVLPVAVQLEDLVDDITALAQRPTAQPDARRRLCRQLEQLTDHE